MSAPATPLSANEVRFYFTRAAVGAGVPWGLGDEAAAAALWLAEAGFDPAAVMAPALAALREGRSVGRIETFGSRQDRSFEVTGGGIASALFAGPALADALALGEEVTLLRVDVPLVVVAALGAMQSERHRTVTIADTVQIVLNRDTFSCAPGFAVLDAVAGPVSLRVTQGGKAHGERRDVKAGRIAVTEQGVNVGDAGWSVVEACFRKCLVPTSDTSRAAGAGAGLTDND